MAETSAKKAAEFMRYTGLGVHIHPAREYAAIERAVAALLDSHAKEEREACAALVESAAAMPQAVVESLLVSIAEVQHADSLKGGAILIRAAVEVKKDAARLIRERGSQKTH